MTKLMQWRDWFLADTFQEPRRRRDALLLLGVSVSVGLWGPPFAILLWGLGLISTGWIHLGATLLIGMVPFLLRSTGSLKLPAHFMLLVQLSSWVALCESTGGFRSPFVVIVTIPVMFSWLFFQGKMRWLWLFASFGALWGLYLFSVLQPHGVVFGSLSILYPLAYVMLCAVCLSVLWFFAFLNDSAFHQLEETNSALADNQQELVKLTHDLSMARDEAIKANRTKSAFLANMSHELRTPLNAVIGYSELLLEEADTFDPANVEDLQKIKAAGQHLLVLISDILDLSKIEAGRIDIHPEACELVTLIKELSLTVMPMAKKSGNQLEIICPPSVGMINTDPTRLRQILLNLLSNACKFTHNGSIELRVIRQIQKDGDWVSFEIEDTGIGMSDEQIQRIFQAFIQADHLTSRKYGGTGLGLAISQRLARILGGDIQVKSQLGQGSTFSLEIPVISPETQSIKRLTQHKTNTSMTAFIKDRPLVLVIDDDPHVHDMLMRILRRENYNVVTAFNGEEGLRLAKELKPAVITLDALMPDVSGWDVLSSLKANPALAAIPVIMISIVDEAERGFALGVSEFLTKPVERERLLSILSHFRARKPQGPVLIVEDDQNTRELLVRMLERNEWTTLEAEHGQAAIELLSSQTPALIITDLMMPEMDGFTLIEALTEHETWRHIPVVVLTAMELSDADLTRLNQHIENLLQKGTHSLQELEEQIKGLLAFHAEESS